MNKIAVVLCAALAAGLAQAAPMMTTWGEKVTPDNAWRGYPRPQMVRANWTNLNGEWDYAVTSVTNTPGRPEKWDGKILVPFPIESALSGVGRLLKPDEFLWYTRTIECDPKPGERILLHFGGVDFRTMGIHRTRGGDGCSARGRAESVHARHHRLREGGRERADGVRVGSDRGLRKLARLAAAKPAVSALFTYSWDGDIGLSPHPKVGDMRVPSLEVSATLPKIISGPDAPDALMC